MTFVGFRRLYIQPYLADRKTPAGDLIVVEGKTNKGATVSAEISGLSKDATKVPGSNIDYYISRKGLGDVKADFGILDLPESESDRLAGYKTSDTSGIVYGGNDTEAPYCGVLLESETLAGEAVLFGFFAGTFTREKISMETLDPNKTYEPKEDSYSFSAIGSDATGPQNGQYFGKYIGNVEKDITDLQTQVLGAPVSGGNPTEPNVPVTGITLEATPKEVKVGESFTIKPTIEPSNATNGTFTLTSSDSKIATVTPVAGKGVGIAPGKVTITGTTTDGNKTGTVEVTVVAAG